MEPAVLPPSLRALRGFGLDPRLKLRHLQCLIAVAQGRSVQRAADQLAVTQPAVSKTLAELEDIVGCPLFERGRSGARPTAAAEALLRHVTDGLAALRQGFAGLRAGPERVASELAIGVLPTVVPELLPPALLAFQAMHPQTVLRVTTAANPQLLAQLRQGDLALVIGRLAEPETMRGLNFELLQNDPMLLVVRPQHPLAHMTGVTLQDVVRYPMVVPSTDTVIRQSLDGLLAVQGLRLPTQRVETLSVTLGRQLARSSDAVWFSPAGAVRADLDDGLLVSLPVPTAGADMPMGIALRTEEPPNTLQLALMQCLRHVSKGEHRG